MKKLGIKSKRAFTLIELLAVIVILGLLMAIAIPSVTKYITESRKKTLTTTVDNYIGALVNDVNDLAYTFTAQNTIYAVPIECIALERGGTDPFGHWHQANDSYFAYVLIQYDDVNSKYVYGFTFKDSAGYGLYPTIQANINEKGSQVKTGYTINKPVTGDLTSLVTLDKWQESGFKVDPTTNLIVLEATSEFETGNGTSTCTLCQKGENYAQVEAEKAEFEKEQERLKKTYALILDNSSDSSNSKPMIFVKSTNEVKTNDVYMSKTYGSLKVLASYTDFDDKTFTSNGSSANTPWYSYRSSVTSIVVEDVIKPVSTAAWFFNFTLANRVNVSNLDVSRVEDMSYMFYGLASKYGVSDFNIVGLDKWDTSKVKDMTGLFAQVGKNSTSWTINTISNWNVSSLVKAEGMFAGAGLKSTSFTLNLSGWNTSSLKDMSYMFAEIGKNANNFSLVGLEGWNTSNATNMIFCFYMTGNKATYSINLSNWNVSNVSEYDPFNEGVATKIIAPSFNK